MSIERDESRITPAILSRIEEHAREAATAPYDFGNVSGLADDTLYCVREIRRLRVNMSADTRAEIKMPGTLDCEAVRLALALLETLNTLRGNRTGRPTTWRVLREDGTWRVQAMYAYGDRVVFDGRGTEMELVGKLRSEGRTL